MAEDRIIQIDTIDAYNKLYGWATSRTRSSTSRSCLSTFLFSVLLEFVVMALADADCCCYLLAVLLVLQLGVVQLGEPYPFLFRIKQSGLVGFTQPAFVYSTLVGSG